MERKIGEIFEYKGEWYQCLKGISCKECDFSSNSITCDIHGAITCTRKGRSDDTSVAFKKLEKTGEPYYSKYLGKSYQRYKTYIPAVGYNFKIRVEPVEHVGENEIFIEIKQKEDMEDNRTINQHFAECGQTINDVVRKCYTENKSTQIKDMEEYKMHDAKEDIPEFDKVVDECLFGKDKLNLKPFDIQKAREGKPVCTRDGRKARIICFDTKGDMCPIIALVEENGIETTYHYDKNGQNAYNKSDLDLMILPEKRSGWVNIDWDCNAKRVTVESEEIYDTKEDALRNVSSQTHKDTVKIEWEE